MRPDAPTPSAKPPEFQAPATAATVQARGEGVAEGGGDEEGVGVARALVPGEGEGEGVGLPLGGVHHRRRIAWVAVSATYSAPEGPTATPLGVRYMVEAPHPFA
jgi:hypothetical protein